MKLKTIKNDMKLLKFNHNKYIFKMWIRTESDRCSEICRTSYSWRTAAHQVKNHIFLTLSSFKEEDQYPKVRKALKLFCKQIDEILQAKEDQTHNKPIEPIKISQLLGVNEDCEISEAAPKYNYVQYLDVKLPWQSFTLRDFFHTAIKALLKYPESHSLLDQLIPEVLPKVCKINKIAKSKELKNKDK